MIPNQKNFIIILSFIQIICTHTDGFQNVSKITLMNSKSIIFSIKTIFSWFLWDTNKSKAGSIIPKSLPVRLILTVWCLVCVVLGNAYRSILTSYLMAPRFHALFDSIEDVAASPYPTFMVLKYTSFETTVLVLMLLHFETSIQFLWYIIYINNYTLQLFLIG